MNFKPGATAARWMALALGSGGVQAMSPDRPSGSAVAATSCAGSLNAGRVGDPACPAERVAAPVEVAAGDGGASAPGELRHAGRESHLGIILGAVIVAPR